jgi:hypothetical protein
MTPSDHEERDRGERALAVAAAEASGADEPPGSPA